MDNESQERTSPEVLGVRLFFECRPARTLAERKRKVFWEAAHPMFFSSRRKKMETVTMAKLNRVILLGNLTRDPELRFIAGKKPVCEVGLAVNDRYKKNDEWIEETMFVDLTLWGRLAEIANEYLCKGSPVLIEGRLKLDSWEKDGQKFSKHKVVVENLQMLGRPRDKEQPASTPNESEQLATADASY